MFNLILYVVATICFVGATFATRGAAHWAWLVPAGLTLFCAAHIPWAAGRIRAADSHPTT